jgi:hypothetical protein
MPARPDASVRARGLRPPPSAMSRGRRALALEVKRGVCTMCMSGGCQLHPR